MADKLIDTYGYKICILLSFMQDRATENKDFIDRIMAIKRQIRIGDPIDDDDQLFFSDIMDDVIRIAELGSKHEDFGKFLFVNADIDAYLPAKNNN
ncbi:hypothetical protein [Chryseobacterium sp. 2R14A]|uniref:hypothetical protein n=1 Tax=Chryseobacterium sp. 2R14A TaxID=3380353 RepID=UPI003CFB06D6